MMSYEVVRYSPEFRPQVIALLAHLVSPDPGINEAYFRWKHEENPYLTEPLIYLALAGQSVVGMRAFLGARWRLGNSGEVQAWPCACDLVVEPAHRGQHLFGKIMRYSHEDLVGRIDGPILNWSANAFTYLASLRTKWNLVGSYSAWAAEAATIPTGWQLRERMRHWRYVWRHADREIPFLSRPGLAYLDRMAKRVPGSISITSQPPVQAMADLVAQCAKPGIQHERDARYYRWRFANQLSTYRFVFLREAGRQGFLVIHQPSGAAGAFRIVDWEASETEVLADLLDLVIAAGGYRRLTTWSSTLSPAVQRILERRGFGPVDESSGNPHYRPGLLAIGPGGVPTERLPEALSVCFRDLAKWDLRMIFSDAY